MGCNGGQAKVALKYTKTNDICIEESRAHRAKGESCQTSICNVGMTSGTVTGVKSPSGLFKTASDADLKSAANLQPVSIAIQADQDIFHHYKGETVIGEGGEGIESVPHVDHVAETCSSNLWVPNPKCCSFLTRHNLHHCKRSSTYASNGAEFKIEYGSGPVSGFYSQDSINIGNVPIDEYLLAEVTDVSGVDIGYTLDASASFGWF